MLCDQCNEKPATVFLVQVINNKGTERNLCESCMSKHPPARWTSCTPTDDYPAEVTLTDPVTVADLATALRAPVFQVVALLKYHGIFRSADDAIDFATASLVCTHYGITPHRVD